VPGGRRAASARNGMTVQYYNLLLQQDTALFIDSLSGQFKQLYGIVVGTVSQIGQKVGMFLIFQR